MSARIIRLPRTAAGRAALRECIHNDPNVCDYRWPDGCAIEEEDFDGMVLEWALPPQITPSEWGDVRKWGFVWVPKRGGR
jgi:hypothetical protein